MKSKHKYSIDKDNQLLIKPPKAKALISSGGAFSVDKKNQLFYRLNEPENWRRVYDLPKKVAFTGKWKLNSNLDLVLNLDETKSQYKGDKLIFKGEVISTDRDTLVFEVISRDRRGLTHIQILKLSGSWQADELNRIIFTVKKKDSPDIITLEGAWQLNKNQQIIYIYEKTILKRKVKFSRTLAFEGVWDINASNRLGYALSRSRESYFNFRVRIESPSLYPRDGMIKYRIGIGLKKNRPEGLKVISLIGSWKFSSRFGLTFQMDYGKGRAQGIEFGADIYSNKRDKVVFLLVNKKREPLAFNITFSRRLLKESDAQAFLRAKKSLSRKENAIEAGVSVPF